MTNPVRLCGAACVLVLAIASEAAGAAPVTVIGGYDHYSGALGQRTDGVIGAAYFTLGQGDAIAAGLRYDDRLIGRGYGLMGGVGVPLSEAVRLRGSVTRFIGDNPFRAWRAKLGPEVGPAAGWRAGIFYSRYQDNAGATSDGALAEGAVPFNAALTGRVSASAGTTPAGPTALAAAVGLSWGVIPHLALSGEVGLARNASGAGGVGPAPGGGGLIDGLPLIGGGSPPPQPAADPELRNQVEATYLMGIRVAFP